MEKSKLQKLQKYANQLLQQYNPENALSGVDKLKEFEPDLLKALLQELKSTKNALLIEEKRYSDPIEIAYRDWAIVTVNVLINKIVSILSRKVKDED